MRYTFFNSGNYFFFRPRDRMFFPHEKHPTLALDFYKNEVRLRNDKSVYILGPNGKEVPV